ncbi:SDR family oxidoreductase [Sorangium sp. So ce260]|uniref:SDR family NAD(P)-dependent oxidoreductase n=1 Tax=Sorangium sp. So ce260 TaxID=3133291 RepID=UPI003F5E40AF
MTFEGKSALLTGASEGIGFAIAEALVQKGARVVIVARREDKLSEAVQRLGRGASYVVGDVADPATARRAVAETVARHGGLDLLVNNAGVLVPGTLATYSAEDVDHMLGVNLRGTFAFTQAAVAPLTGRKGAAILMVSSIARRANVPGTSMYGATKVGLIYLTRSWAIELAPAGIRVNCISPGLTDTPALRSAARHIPSLVEDQISRALIKRAAPPEEIARVALMLLDERSSGFVTGSNWDVDGGGHLG